MLEWEKQRWWKGRERKVQVAKPPFSSVHVEPAGTDGQRHCVQPLGSSWPGWAPCLGSLRAFRMQQKETLVNRGSTVAFICSCDAALITFPLCPPLLHAAKQRWALEKTHSITCWVVRRQLCLLDE